MWEVIAKATRRGRRKFPERLMKLEADGKAQAIAAARQILNAEGDWFYAITSVRQL